MSIRVGNELGAGNVTKTKRAIYVSLGAMGNSITNSIVRCTCNHYTSVHAYILLLFCYAVINVVCVLCVTLGLRNYLGGFYNAEE